MNIFKKPLLLIAASLFMVPLAQAQEGMAVYTDYLTDNYYLIHPSMAGAAHCAKVRLTAQRQWADQSDAPSLQTLSFNTRVGEQSGVGAILFNDENGYHSQIGAKLTYAHHLNFSRSDYDLNQLSLGLSVGMFQTTLDETEFLDDGVIDPTVRGGLKLKDQYFNFDVGASYHYLDFYAHLTVKNLIAQKADLYSDMESDNSRRYLLSAGYVFGNSYDYLGRSSGFTWEPSFMFQYAEETQEKKLDVNLKMYKDFDSGQFYAGVSYRTTFDGAEYRMNVAEDVSKQYYHAVSPIIGLRYKNLMIGYTYTHHFGDIQFANGGFHQLTLGFNFLCKDSAYKCNCPSVNY